MRSPKVWSRSGEAKMATAPTGDETLGPDDVTKVLRELLPAQNHSFVLGLELQIPLHVVESIEATHLEHRDRLLHVLIEFAKQLEPRPTWRVIIDALKSPTVNLSYLAGRVEAAHFSDLNAIREAVPEITEPTATTDVSPDLTTPSTLSPEEFVHAEITQLDKRFHTLKNATRENLEKHRVPVKEIADTLTSLSPDDDEMHTIFLDKHFEDLFNAPDHSELFGRMNFHWNYLNYPLLDHLVKRFDLKEVKNEMEAYKADLKQFREKTPLKLFCQTQTKKRTPPNFREIVAEFQWPEDREPVLEDVEKFRKAYADHYNLREFCMMLDKVRPGSIIATWLIPESIVGKLKTNLPLEILKVFFVTKLEIDGHCVYSAKSELQIPFASSLSSSGYSSAASLPALVHGNRDCLDFKLLGECKRHAIGRCPFLHENQERTVRKTVELPERTPLAGAMKRDYFRILQKIAECRLQATSRNSVDIVVSESNEHHLPEIEREYMVLLSQLYPIGPGWCYIHRDGVDQCKAGGLLHFKLYEGRPPRRPGDQHRTHKNYELRMTVVPVSDEAASPKVDVTNPPRESETKEGLYKAIERAHGGRELLKPGESPKDVGVIIIDDHEPHMKDKLKGSLEWFCREKRGKGQFAAKLEARFGKILWRNVPRDMLQCSWGIQQFADFCFTNTRHSRSFTANVREESGTVVRRKLNEKLISVLETFDIKLTIMGSSERKAVDLRIKFEDGSPIVLLAKRNEAKLIVLDVLCLHRDHDIRMTLNCYEVMNQHSPEYDLVEQLVKSVSLSDPEEATITLVTRTDEWSVNFIRHKKRGAYRIDDKFIVTVTDIRECQFERQELHTCVAVTPDCYRDLHTETEVHNCAWECAFGRDVGFSPENALALHMDHPTLQPEIAGAVPHPWQPDSILKDFHDFWENLDSLSEMLQ